jgi:hypothetical protein
VGAFVENFTLFGNGNSNFKVSAENGQLTFGHSFDAPAVLETIAFFEMLS